MGCINRNVRGIYWRIWSYSKLIRIKGDQVSSFSLLVVFGSVIICGLCLLAEKYSTKNKILYIQKNEKWKGEGGNNFWWSLQRWTLVDRLEGRGPEIDLVGLRPHSFALVTSFREQELTITFSIVNLWIIQQLFFNVETLIWSHQS